MNDTTQAQAPAKAKSAPELEPVKMDDGRIVEFSAKKRLIKTTEIADGAVFLRMDYRNGETRRFQLPSELILHAAAHGMSQKYGDEIAGEKDLDDAILAVDELNDRIQKGEWNVERAAEGLSGASVLLRALVEVSGQSKETVRSFLATLTAKQKVALREIDPVVSPVVKRLEDEKAKKAGQGVDTGALLTGLIPG